MSVENRESISTCQYPFSDWEKVFADWKEWAEVFGSENMQLVISENPHSEGYWIEKRGVKCSVDDHVYIDDQVEKLEQRVREGVAKRKKSGLHNGIIL